MVCLFLSTNNGPRSDVCALTVAWAPGGFESIVTSWYGPWTIVAHPLRTASASAEKVTCRVIGPPLPCGMRLLAGRHHPGSRGRADAHAAAAGLLGLAQYGFLEGLGDREADLLPGRNLDRLPRLGVPAHAGLHLAEPEDAQPRDLDGLALLDALLDNLDQTVEYLIALLATYPTCFCEFRHQLRLRHRSTSIPGDPSGMIAEKRALLRQAYSECQENPRQSRASTLFSHSPTGSLGRARGRSGEGRLAAGVPARSAARTHGSSGEPAVVWRKCTIWPGGPCSIDARFVHTQPFWWHPNCIPARIPRS